MRFGHYYRCYQEIIRITSLHLGGNRPTYTTYGTLNCDIPHNSYPYITKVDEASEIRMKKLPLTFILLVEQSIRVGHAYAPAK